MESQILIAGFGGQGVLLIGQALARAAMLEGKEVSWIPSYGPEVRGGEANCGVVIAEESIGSPLVTEPVLLAAMNAPSLQKYASWVAQGGILLYNASLADAPDVRKDIRVHAVPCNAIAENAGSVRSANMVMLGAIIKLLPLVSVGSVMTTLHAMMGPDKADLIAVNRAAVEKGMAAV
ncbi:MAG: 2-oxoacid:acceptor oxidoreductase family protein [Clostridia bacterium]|nr:2-oxoacid:acceptor oxidoreductase family protein [Clostridia bacterium]